MQWPRRIMQAFRERREASVRPGRLIVPRAEDSVRDYPSAGLTPRRLLGILQEADEGSLSAAMQLFEEMEEKDPHLYAVANTRRLALNGLEWQITSAAERSPVVDRALADETAAYCRETLAALDTFDETLQHLSLALGRNIAVSEIIWEVRDGSLTVVDLQPVDFVRLVFNELDEVRILTADSGEEGVELPAHKFVVHTPHSVCGHAQRGGLLRVTALSYLAKNLALKDWMIFAELFGMPVRLARYEPSASAEEKQEMLKMLETLGTHAAGIFSKAVELEFVESKQFNGDSPYQRLVEFLNREMSKAWLGQTLTTDTSGQRAALASTQVHELVRQDVLQDDIRKEGQTIRRDLLAPLARLRFGPEVPVPYFRRKPGRPRELSDFAHVLDRVVNDLGGQVPAQWALDALGIPAALPDEPTLAGRSTE
jgi:phage gp29-like protein